MPNLATQIADATILQQIAALREAQFQIEEVDKILLDAEASIRELIHRAPTNFSRVRSKKLLRDVGNVILGLTPGIKKTLKTSLKGIAAHSHSSMSNTLNNVFSFDISNPNINTNIINIIIDEEPFGGFWSGFDFYRTWPHNTRALYKKLISQGILAGKSKGSLIEDIFSHPSINLPKYQVRNWVRTSSAGVANAARMQFWEENEDLINGIEWLSTLDERTSNICKVLDGKQWNNENVPIGHKFRYPGAIAHFQCRSTQIPILKSWEELSKNKKLGRKLDALEDKVNIRAALNGPVHAGMKYEDWLLRQSKAIQISALGKSRWELWSNKKIKMNELITLRLLPKKLSRFYDKINNILRENLSFGPGSEVHIDDIFHELTKVSALAPQANKLRKFMVNNEIGSIFYNAGYVPSEHDFDKIRKYTESFITNNESIWNTNNVGGWTSQFINNVYVSLHRQANTSQANVPKVINTIWNQINTPGTARVFGNHLDPSSYSLASLIHELGHQVQFKAGLSDFNDMLEKWAAGNSSIRPLTRYAETNNREWFAESFSAWFFNREKLTADFPEIAKIIEEALEKAIGP